MEKINRRSFLKWLAVAVPTLAIAPAAGAKLAAEMAQMPAKTGRPEYVFVSEWISMDELQRRYPPGLDKNPILRGELGIYEGVTIYNAK